MLNTEEEEYLRDLVVRVLAVTEHPHTLLGGYLPPECMDNLPYLNSPAAYARTVLKICVADRWKNFPCCLRRMLDMLPDEPQVAALKTRFDTRPPLPPSPELMRVLASHQPFLDREDLRDKVTTLAANKTARPILVINGASNSGKSYTYNYISHLVAAEWLKFVHCLVPFESASGLLFGPVELARDILTNMGVRVDELPPTFFENLTNTPRWAYDLAGKVLASRPEGKRFWIVLDNFHGANLRAETIAFIDGLCRRIVNNGLFADDIRLVLLNYDRTLLTVESRFVESENIKKIEDRHVREGTLEIFTHYRKEPPSALLDGTVAKILADLPDERRACEINGRLQVLIDQLRPS